jgi:hypothetical protein
MSDPRRWLEGDTGLTESERRALSAGLDMQPSRALEREVWAGLEARLAALAPGGEREAADAGGTPSHSLPSATGNTSGAAGSAVLGSGGGIVATASSLVRVALLGVTLGGVAVGVQQVIRHLGSQQSSRAIESPANSESSLGKPREATPPLLPAATPSAAPTPDAESRSRSSTAETPRASHQVAAGPSASRLTPRIANSGSNEATARADGSRSASEEARLLGAARSLLRSQDAAGALMLLDQAGREFPRGVLEQEREALTVDAFVALGRRSDARTRSLSFLRRWSNSPYSKRMQTLLSSP